MEILKKSLLSVTLLALVTLCINAETQDKTVSKQVQTQKKETEAQKLGKKLLELLQNIVQKHVKMCCPCCPGNQSCAIDTKTDTEIKQEQEEKEKNIQKAIDLIEKGADVNCVNEIGTSPLFQGFLVR